jgi:hypothetical protein
MDEKLPGGVTAEEFKRTQDLLLGLGEEERERLRAEAIRVLQDPSTQHFFVAFGRAAQIPGLAVSGSPEFLAMVSVQAARIADRAIPG